MSERFFLVFFFNHWQDLIPAARDFLAPLGVLLVLLQFWALSQLLPRRTALPLEIRLLAVWGGVVLLLTLFGIVVPQSSSWIAAGLAGLALLIWLVPSWRPDWREGLALGRTLVLMSGLLLSLLTLRPSSLDSFFNLLPNVEYLWDFGRFPASDLARTDSVFPALPYNTQLVGYLASWYLPFYPTSAMVYFNVVVQGFFGLFLARLIARELLTVKPFSLAATLPNWSHLAIGILLATALSPGFRLEYLLADHGEASTMVTLAFAVWVGIAVLTEIKPSPAGSRTGVFGLSAELWGRVLMVGQLLAALINIRQSNLTLVVAFAVAILVLAMVERRPLVQTSLTLVASLFLPGLLWLAWRGFVSSHFVQGELAVRAMTDWSLTQLQAILLGMVNSVVVRPFMFLLYGGLLAYGMAAVFSSLRGKGLRREQKFIVVFAVILLVWNLSLIVTYLAVEDKLQIFGASAEEARSYFRYNSHLILLCELVLMLICIGRGGLKWVADSVRERPRLVRNLTRAILILILIAPFLFLRQVRYDLQTPRPELWRVAHLTAWRIRDDDSLAIVIHGSAKDSSFLVLRGLIAMTEPRRAGVHFSELRFSTAEQLEQIFVNLKQNPKVQVLLLCSPTQFAAIPSRHSGFFRLNGGQWSGEDLGPLAESWTRQQYWAKSFQAESFCLK
ncbi:MAG: hypothetical protein ORO03_09135 [Alphaproteobacteria bacterium]|nr:hypothetical protein [Alphaproteobacteria bacterium]